MVKTAQGHTGLWRSSVLLALLLWVLMLSPAMAQSDSDSTQSELESIERAAAADQAKAEALAQEAAALREEIASLRSNMIAAARKSQDLETELTASEEKLLDLETQSQAKQAALVDQQARFVETLGALQRIALRPTDSLVASPDRPVDTLRSAMLLSYAVPEIESRAKDLRGELESLEALRREIAYERQSLEDSRRALDSERDRLGTLVDRKRALESDATAAQKQARERASQQAAKAKDLRDLIRRLEEDAARRAEAEAKARAEAAARAKAEAEARAQAEAAAAVQAQAQAEIEAERSATEQQQASLPPAVDIGPGTQPDQVRPFPSSPNTQALVLPVRGRVIRRYGEAEPDSGESAKGLSFATRAAAQIVAPYDGQVAYAGPFRGYGRILIIEHGGRYHTLLAGLDRVDVVEGQWVLAGEPVGFMTPSGSSDPVLYLELRRTGQPINPMPWLAISDDKVQG